MLTRRRFIQACGSWGVACSSGLSTLKAQVRKTANLPNGIGIDPDYTGPLPEERLGTKRPLKAEEKIALDIIGKAPQGSTPYDVARYFLAVADGKYGEEWKPYVKAWPERWNPVIVDFFQATDLKPAGDETSWCAAFVNWCFQQSANGVATHSASSGSFRCFGTQTDNPTQGDVVVFKHVGDDAPCIGHGHVGFFVKDYGDKIEVLGGNQIEGHERSHMISSKPLSKQGPVLNFHSYRTESRLHNHYSALLTGR